MAKGVLGFFFGNKPKVPDYKQVSPETEQASAISQNAATLPGAQSLALGVNQFNLEELAKALQFSLPGGLQKAQANINSQLAGELDPSDTSALIRNSTAAGFGMGIGRGGIGRNLVLRDLGRSSQAQRQQGFQNFLALSQATQAPRMDVTSMFFSPQQRVSLALQQNENQFSRDWLASQISAAPHPAGAYTAALIKDAVVAFAGGAGGAMGGK